MELRALINTDVRSIRMPLTEYHRQLIVSRRPPFMEEVFNADTPLEIIILEATDQQFGGVE